MLIGVDEAGRGAWAGPLVAAAVCLRPHKKFHHPLLRDSKKLSANQRREVFSYLQTACEIGVGVVTAKEIDKWGLQRANVVAVERALDKLEMTIVSSSKGVHKERLVIDYIGGFKTYTTLHKSYSLHKFGEQKFPEIAAASIIAKVTRDSMMEKLSKLFPAYKFELHKGYGTKLHRQNLESHGPSSIHRQSFSPLKKKRKAPPRLKAAGPGPQESNEAEEG